MSSDLRAARRYAGALFQLARERNELDEVAAGLREVAQVATQSRELMNVLRHPRITRERKKELLHKVFGGVRADIERFLFLLIEKDRAAILPDTSREFDRLLDEHRGEADAEAITAAPLSETQRSALLSRLEASTGLKIRLVTRVDESILGGLIVRVGDHLIDGSVASRLRLIKEQLKQAKVT